MTNPKHSADTLRDRARALLAQAAAQDARNRSAERKADTRRKIILGGYFLSLVGGDISKISPDILAKLSSGIRRPSDRRALGLLPLEGESNP